MFMPTQYEYIETPGKPIKAWVKGVPLEDAARQQLMNVASMPFIHKHVAVMPDVHFGMGATVGSVIATKGAIIPAAVGVDIGCGMMAQQTTLRAHQLPDSLKDLREKIERAVPHGFVTIEGRSKKGNYEVLPAACSQRWETMRHEYDRIVAKHPKANHAAPYSQVGTLGGGNHFIEICLDEFGDVWVMLHSGSRGAGNKIGTYFIELARHDMRKHFINLPDEDLAYLVEGTEHFEDYIEAMTWAQDYAWQNRQAMMATVLRILHDELPAFQLGKTAVNCHHNYTQRENHFGENVWLTRKGAVRARTGDLGIIPGSMGAKSFIVRGKGNPDSFHSCSHGAGRTMSRGQATRTFTVDDHEKATVGIECRKDADVIDETPAAYKSIEAVMAAQSDLVDVVFTLKQVLCIKG